MTYRYDIPVNVVYDIDEELVNLRILKFTIQPIVENSFVHAFQGIKRNFEILIRIFSEKDFVNILVADNGIGMGKDALDNISGTLESNMVFKEKLTGIGLENIHQRLIMEFGPPSGLQIDSKEGGNVC